jgi:hypothetical protein
MTAEERQAALRVKYFGNGICDTSHGTFKKFGQELAMPAATVLDCVKAGAGVIPSADFDAIHWTVEERTNKHARKGEAFLSRHWQAMAAMKRFREELEIAELAPASAGLFRVESKG